MKSNGMLKSERPQLNFRMEPTLKENVEKEIKRQGRKRDVVAERVWKHFLSMKPAEREAICARAASVAFFFCLCCP